MQNGDNMNSTSSTTQTSRATARRSLMAQVPSGLDFTMVSDVDHVACGDDLLYWVGDIIDDGAVVGSFSMPDWYHQVSIEWLPA